MTPVQSLHQPIPWQNNLLFHKQFHANLTNIRPSITKLTMDLRIDFHVGNRGSTQATSPLLPSRRRRPCSEYGKRGAGAAASGHGTRAAGRAAGRARRRPWPPAPVCACWGRKAGEAAPAGGGKQGSCCLGGLQASSTGGEELPGEEPRTGSTGGEEIQAGEEQRRLEGARPREDDQRRQRTRCAAMTDEQREEKNRKRREAYRRKKSYANKENEPGLTLLDPNWRFDLVLNCCFPDLFLIWIFF